MRFALLLAAALALGSCGNSDDDGPPAGLGADCNQIKSCRSGYGCALNADLDRYECVALCKADADCPSWHEAGCAGRIRLSCGPFGTCVGKTCDAR